MAGILRIPEIRRLTRMVRVRPCFQSLPRLERRMEFTCVFFPFFFFFFRHFCRWLDNIYAGLIYKGNEKRRRREKEIKKRFADFTIGDSPNENRQKMEKSWKSLVAFVKTRNGTASGAIFSPARLRALGFDECCVIECNHNNVLFGMLSKVHRCINKMHLILNGQTGGERAIPPIYIVNDMKPIPGTTKRQNFCKYSDLYDTEVCFLFLSFLFFGSFF